jgi:hypothetical protein
MATSMERARAQGAARGALPRKRERRPRARMMLHQDGLAARMA